MARQALWALMDLKRRLSRLSAPDVTAAQHFPCCSELDRAASAGIPACRWRRIHARNRVVIERHEDRRSNPRSIPTEPS